MTAHWGIEDPAAIEGTDIQKETAFVSAFLCIRWLVRYVATHDFTIFAWYRIAFGLVVLATAYTGVVNWSN